MRIGAYFYPWYNQDHWDASPQVETPIFGKYYSDNHDLIGYQLALLKLAGIDFAIIQYSPSSVWSGDLMRATTAKIFAMAADYELKLSFLLDGADVPANVQYSTEHDQFQLFAALTEEIGLYQGAEVFELGPDGRPLLFAFAPSARDAVRLRKQFPEYFWRFPIFHGKRWSHRVRDPREKVLSASIFPWGEIALRRSFRSVLEPLGFIPFWTQFDQHRVFGDFAAVNPGYDDRALKRGNDVVPVVERRDGAEFARQLGIGGAEGSRKYLLVYSWNEYFEQTQIEPTDAEGMRGMSTRLRESEGAAADSTRPPFPDEHARRVRLSRRRRRPTRVRLMLQELALAPDALSHVELRCRTSDRMTGCRRMTSC